MKRPKKKQTCNRKCSSGRIRTMVRQLVLQWVNPLGNFGLRLKPVLSIREWVDPRKRMKRQAQGKWSSINSRDLSLLTAAMQIKESNAEEPVLGPQTDQLIPTAPSNNQDHHVPWWAPRKTHHKTEKDQGPGWPGVSVLLFSPPLWHAAKDCGVIRKL